MSSSYVSRVNQLDAGKLDDEIFRIFSTKIHESSQLFAPGVIERWSPEINASLRTIIWVWTLIRGKSTLGQKLLNLTYADLTKNKAVLLVLMSVVPHYLEEKYLDPNRLISARTKPFVKYLDVISTAVSALSFLNLLIFLHRGTQPFLKERLLGIRSSNVTSHVFRDIGYSFMIRELLWHGLINLFSTGLPMINYHYMRQLFRKLFPKSQAVINETPSMDLNTLCPYCNLTPVLPRHAGCCHLYCYYCMQAHFTAAESFDCLACGAELHRDNMKAYIVLPDHK
ncbi:peroxisome biogenesis factor 2 [Microplitis demolitor]|uniref:peroxisome biogenesis factor 2 n=1 Tax=Microplitis demolitor TaxID=69319 RepID=UPI0004CDBE29|nr:peroxisome biogenesis factor 2 [Microplitis demolitor]